MWFLMSNSSLRICTPTLVSKTRDGKVWATPIPMTVWQNEVGARASAEATSPPYQFADAMRERLLRLMKESHVSSS